GQFLQDCPPASVRLSITAHRYLNAEHHHDLVLSRESSIIQFVLFVLLTKIPIIKIEKEKRATSPEFKQNMPKTSKIAL
ncbi:MAG: hypothetical protein MR870_04550, partial [Clostridiales bacterium]|nr:hypothetical protein [Clostridiales bacterium]